MNGLNRTNFDVAIVGAGPAGSTAAIRLAQNGLKILLVEQKQFPRAKLCGEFISPECLTHFAELNVLTEISAAGGVSLNRTVFYARNGRSVTVPNEWFKSNSSALGLSRAEMDRQLIIKAGHVGVEVLEETQATALLGASSPHGVSSPHVSEGSTGIKDPSSVCGLRLKGKTGEKFNVNASLTIDATGRSRELARQINRGNDNGRRHRAEFVAFKTHLEAANAPDGDCEIYAYRGGYGGLNRVENGLHNLCFIVSSKIAKNFKGDANRLLKEIVCKNERAFRSLGGARVIGDWLAVPIQSYGRAELSPAKGLLTIGDAAAFIDPFTGSGILLALESAKIAADIIIDKLSQPEDVRWFEAIAEKYQEQYSLAFDHRLRVSSLLRRAAFVPFLAETVIKTLSLNQSLTRRLAQATRLTNKIA